VAPVTVSDDRMSFNTHFGPDGPLAHQNLVCIAGDLTGPESFGGPIDFLADSLLDGFTARDGDIGVQAQSDRRGRSAARTEWRLMAATQNLRKLHQHFTAAAS